MYRIAQWIKRSFPFIWTVIEWMNSWLFRIRYGNRLESISTILKNFQGEYIVREANPDDAYRLAEFFKQQPEEAFTFFRPHAFDTRTILSLIKRKSFLCFLVLKDDVIVGYFFLRCFAQGKCFRGKIVDYRWRGRGIAKMMGRASTDIAQRLGLRVFGTISKENVFSIASSVAVNEIKIIDYLPNDYVYIEYFPKKRDGA